MKAIVTSWITVWLLLLGSAGPIRADFTFSAPLRLRPPAWSAGGDPRSCCFSQDGLELYFSENRAGGHGGSDIWVARREAVGAPWGEPVNLGPNVNGPSAEADPSISPDGLELYFRYETEEWLRICSRPSRDAPWGKPVRAGAPLGGYHCINTQFSADGLSLYFASNRPGSYGHADLWVSTRPTTADPWSEPVNLGPDINGPLWEMYPSPSCDGRVLFFLSNRRKGGDVMELMVSTRATPSDPWGPPVPCDAINQLGGYLADAALAPDGSTLYLLRTGKAYQCSVLPIVDFSADRLVDIEDLVALIEHWGQEEPAYDMGPQPWGDGVVDAADLEVLMSYWGQELPDPNAVLPAFLAAHWKLDETEGDVAHDEIADHSGILHGGPVWLPAGGYIDGALLFDGIDDCIQVDNYIKIDNSYSHGTIVGGSEQFSVFAWVKDGGPNQAIIAGNYVPVWLILSPTGTLMTELRQGVGGAKLVCESFIPDGDWHRVGFAWDGSYRILYVDDAEVIRDTASSLLGVGETLCIGGAKGRGAGIFWSGLIDDVQIYDRAVKP